MRLVSFSVLVALAACGPKVDPQSPFDIDDPRAARADQPDEIEAPTPVVAATPTPPAAYIGPMVREGTIERTALNATLDAQPGELLRCFEVAAVEESGKFAGWRLVRFMRDCKRFDGVDIAVGDVLVSVNGRVLVKPTDLGDLWKELYTADLIVAELRRGPAPIQLRYAITGSAPVAPAGGQQGQGQGQGQ